jgi:hypothetical protein
VIRNGAYWKIGYQYVFSHHNGMPRSKYVVARKGATFDGLAATVLLTLGLYCFPLLFWLITPFMLHPSPFYFLLLQYPSSYRNVKYSVPRNKCAA